MNPFSQLNGFEFSLVLSLIMLVVLEFMKACSSREWVSVYRPTLFVAVIMAYYTILGPLRALAQDETYYRGLDHRHLLIWGWLGAVVSYGSLLLGFYVDPRARSPKRMILRPDPDRLHRLGVGICQFGLSMFAFVNGIRLLVLLNPFAANQLLESGLTGKGFDVGAASNYFNYSINLLIPGLCIMMAAWLRQRRHTLTFAIWLLAAAAIFISMGFRYRLVLLFIPLLLLFFLARRKRPSVSLLAVFLAIFISLNGIIGLTRTYGRGLDISSINDASAADLFGAGFQDSVVFLTTSGVIEQTPTRSPFIGIEPLRVALLYPVPRAFFPGKPLFSYISDATAFLYGGENIAQGSAFLNYAEYYLIAGWPSLIALSAFLGWLLRLFWNWFVIRQNEPFAQVLYLLTTSYMFVVISRGYLAQVVMLFAFTVAPLFWLYGRWAQRVVPLRATPPVPSLPRG